MIVGETTQFSSRQLFPRFSSLFYHVFYQLMKKNQLDENLCWDHVISIMNGSVTLCLVRECLVRKCLVRVSLVRKCLVRKCLVRECLVRECLVLIVKTTLFLYF